MSNPMSKKSLVRPQEGRVLFGVCAGISQYFGIDATLVRILWVLLTFVAGSGVLMYVILAIVMPNASDDIITAVPTASDEPAAPVGTSLGGDIIDKVEGAIDRATDHATDHAPTDTAGRGGA